MGTFSAALTMAGVSAKTMAPRMGNVPLAAFLKNSRRDWSSSLFFFSFIGIEVNAYRPPNIGN